MARILFAWELGANLGHLARDLPIAERLRAMGHHVAFAVRDTAVAAKLLWPKGFKFIQAPLAIDIRRGHQAPANFAELLLAEDYGRLEGVQGRVLAWCSVFDLARPDVVVADHAPTALFAAHVVALPGLALGSGFEIPPQISPLPSIRPWEAVSAERLVRAEQSILDTLGKVAKRLGGKPLERLADLFVNAVLTTHPELDHYGQRNAGLYVGAMPTLGAARQVTWPKGTGPRIFTYVRPSQHGFVEVLKTLAQFDGVALTAAPGISKLHQEQFSTARHHIYPEHVQISELLQQAAAVVTYAGAGLTAQALLSGVPLLLLPQNVEQWLGAQRVKSLGAGIVLEKERGVGDVSVALASVLDCKELRSVAKQFAQRYRGLDVNFGIKQACQAVLSMAGVVPTPAM